ncbi:MAG TPA: glycosyltransferase family A protein [Saprospiraceae bacterium]|nr:glycosyltransferase family A protein [Saprospiraceae bacterium]
MVSIITPTYNHARFIAQCIESVLQQGYPDWEMIIVNDGSTDQTGLIAQQYAEKDSRIYVINQANKGVFKLGEIYNTALHISKGKYIAILEGDDTWEPYKLEHQVDILEKDPSIVLTWGKIAVVNEDGTEIYYESPEANDQNLPLLFNSPIGSIVELYTIGSWINPQSILIRKDSLMEMGGFLQTHGMPLVDLPTFLTLSLKGPFYFENTILGSWRMYATQTTKKYTLVLYEGRKEFIKEHLSKIPDQDKEKAKKINTFFEQACLEGYARSGRYKLIRKEFRSARKDYIAAITSPVKGKMVWRLRAVVGFVVSFLHLDVEWIAKLMGKRTYDKG